MIVFTKGDTIFCLGCSFCPQNADTATSTTFVYSTICTTYAGSNLFFEHFSPTLHEDEQWLGVQIITSCLQCILLNSGSLKTQIKLVRFNSVNCGFSYCQETLHSASHSSLPLQKKAQHNIKRNTVTSQCYYHFPLVLHHSAWLRFWLVDYREKEAPAPKDGHEFIEFHLTIGTE